MANEKRTLVEVSPHGVQLLSVSGRTVTGWIGKGGDAKEAVAEFVQAAEGVPFALLAPKRHAVLRGEGDASSSSSQLAGLLDGAAGGVTQVVVDAANGRAIAAAGGWVGVGVPQENAAECSQALVGFGVVASASGLALAAHIGAVVACLRLTGSSDRVAIWTPGETSSSLTVVSADGVVQTAMIPSGYPQVYEAVQLALGLKFKSAAQKLFANEGYDFSAAGKKAGEKLAESLAGPLKECGGASALHVVGFSAVQSAWIVPALAESLGISAWTPDFGPWLSGKGWSVAGDVTLSACAAGVLGAAVQPDVWIVASAPVKPAEPVKAAPVAASPVIVPAAPAPAKPPVPAAPVAAPVAKAAEAPKSAPAPAAKPAVQPKPAPVAKPAPAPAPVPKPTPKAAPQPPPSPVTTNATAGKAPATIGGVPVPFVISGVALSLLVGAGVFFLKNKEEPPVVVQNAPAVAPVPAPQPVARDDRDSSSLSDLLAPPAVPGLPKQGSSNPAASAPAVARPNVPAASSVIAGDAPSVPGLIPATDFIAQGASVYRNSLYEALLFEGGQLMVVRQKGRPVLTHPNYQTTHTPPGPGGKPGWKTLDKFQVAQTQVARVNLSDGGARFVIVQENSRARAEHEITCLSDRIDVKTKLTPRDYVTGVEGRVFTYSEWNWIPDLMPTGSKIKSNSQGTYVVYNDGSTVRLLIEGGFGVPATETDDKTRAGISTYLGGAAMTRVHFNGTEPVTYGPLAVSVRFE